MDSASSLTVVALPSPGTPVWKLSSEKVPHMTLLFLGDQSKNSNVNRIVEFVEHAAKSSMCQFGLSVNRRGLLGEHDADVLFFDVPLKSKIREFRSYLLAQDDISKAYASVEQYPQWTPHLTLGYPETPAKESEWDVQPHSWVNFDRIAIWTGDYEGPTFQLDSYLDGFGGETYMSDEAIENALKHFGIKGMKWGIRRGHRDDDGSEPVTVTQKKPGGHLSAKGGRGHRANEDAIGAKASSQKIKKSGLQSLSNKELQNLVTRMNLEQQYVNLKAKEPGRFAAGAAALKKVLGLGKTLNEVHSLVNSPAGKEFGKLVKKK